MKKIKLHTDHIEGYYCFLKAPKSIASPIRVSEVKGNHKKSLYKEAPISCDASFGNNCFGCEVRRSDVYNYSFQFLTDQLKHRVLFRLDEGNGTHKNHLPNVPLSQLSIPTPHIHHFDNDGNWIAYRPGALASISEPLHINDGFACFCQEGVLSSPDGTMPTLKVQEDGAFPLEVISSDDPLEGIIF